MVVAMLISFIMKKDSDIAQFQDELGMPEKPSTEMIHVNSGRLILRYLSYFYANMIYLQITLFCTINRLLRQYL